MTPHTFRQILEQAMRLSLASSPLLLGACLPDTTGYESPLCDNSNVAVRGLSPPVIPDVVELRSGGGSLPDGGVAFTVLSRDGTPCATAADAGACAAAFAALDPQGSIGGGCFGFCASYYLATTRGDEVRAYSSVEEVKAFLGAIDTAQEAAILTWASGYRLACNDLTNGGIKTNADGSFEVIATSGVACGPGTSERRNFFRVLADGTLRQTREDIIRYGDPNCAIGRRPHGLVARRGDRHPSGASPLGRFFADAARLEAASVPAFLRLREELRAHRAPPPLLASALLAAIEEVTHAESTRALAARFGGVPCAPVVRPRPLRSLAEVAIENATEGCVRETFGALVAQRQAARAQNPHVRAALGHIAVDEARHAALSWEIDGWAQRKLGRSDRSRLRAARKEAVAALKRELAAPVDPVLQREAGLPGPEEARASADLLFASLGAVS